ncbi:Protein INO4 [Pseudocercospora fuligena]|uniref:Protein INO4 n=1 Tax=Pseudocercospora fuligena TaxID=685502 RepID=A0A8H6VPL6_9PEZI|nr:Protein INO4 [Pseudocercospora fuligena]
MMNPNTMSVSQSPLTPAKARLSDQQKKDNHISSEKKRREAIRAGFDKLSTLVPGMEGQARSEAIVLGATVHFMQDEIARRHTVTQLAINAGWSRQQVEEVYTRFENTLRAQEQSAEAAAAGLGQGQQAPYNGQGQFQNVYQVPQPATQPAVQPQVTPSTMPQQQAPQPATAQLASRPKSNSPVRTPEEKDAE